MLNNEHHIISCELGSEIVAYLYDELSTAERGLFEDHLADCMTCTDEFAAASNSRFSVFEWHKEEFVPLSTPAFPIPYAENEPVRAGWFAGLAELIASARSPLAIAASLVVLLGIGAFAFYLAPFTGTPDTAGVAAPDQKAPSVALVPAIEGTVTPSVETPSVRAPHVVNAEVTTKNRVNRAPRSQTLARNLVNDNSIPAPLRTNVKKPALSTYADDEDRSLRLAALFDEIGGVKK